jgi:hypothetical protein
MKAFARIVSVIFNPVVYIGLFLLYLLGASGGRLLGPATLGFLFLGAIPAALLLYGIRRGWWADLDISNLRERRTYLPWVVVSALCLLLLASWLHFPRLLRFSLTAMVIWLVLTTGVSWFWKISIHEGATVGIVVLMWLLFGPAWGLALVWTPFLVGWARWVLNKHTLAQLIAGGGAAFVSIAAAWILGRP